MKLGLQEKITLSSDMTEDIRDEVRSTFMEAMRHNLLHPCKCQVVGGSFYRYLHFQPHSIGMHRRCINYESPAK